MKIIKFYSERCIPCRMLQGFLDDMKIDTEAELIDNGSNLADTHNVMSVPTLLFLDNDGKEVGRVVGFNSQKANEIKYIMQKK